jgi:transposase
MTKPKTKNVNDFSRCLDPLDMDATLIAVIEMSQTSWLVAGIVPGVEREPLKKLAIDEHALLNLLRRWRAEAEKQGHRITRIAVAFEAGPDGFWLARSCWRTCAAKAWTGPRSSAQAGDAWSRTRRRSQ